MARASRQVEPVRPEVELDHRFICVRAETIADGIARDADRFGPVAAGAHRLLEAIALVIEQESGSFGRALDRAYAPFNPDRDTLEPDAPADQSEAATRLCRALRYLFVKANFIPLGEVEIDRAISTANSAGLRVRLDPDRVEHLELFARGQGCVERRSRNWRAPVRGRLDTFPVHNRLGVVVRLKGDDHLLLKLFRDIPVFDIEALLPHANIQMGWFDRAQVALGGAGAFGGVAMKIVQGGALLTPSGLLVPAAVAFGGLGFRSFMGYRRARKFRTGQRTHHLYHHGLANNAAVLHALVGLVASEEIKEALLLYALLSAGGLERPDADTARLAVEAWLRERFEAEVEFDIDDALETMDRLRLWRDRGRLEPLGPDEAVERLTAHAVGRRSGATHVLASGLRGSGAPGSSAPGPAAGEPG